MPPDFFDLLKTFARLLAVEIEKARVQLLGAIGYDIHPVDLSTPRDNKEYPWGGDYLIVQAIDGELDARLDKNNATVIELDKLRKINTSFNRLYLTNTAQAGKTATLYIGKGFMADLGDVAVKAAIDLVKTAVEALPPKIDYFKSPDEVKGEDNTEVSSEYVGQWDLLKGIAIVASSDSPIEKIVTEARRAGASEQNRIKITEQQAGQSENDVVIRTPPQSTKYTAYIDTLATPITTSVIVRIYLWNQDGSNNVYNRSFRNIGYTVQGVYYL